MYEYKYVSVDTEAGFFFGGTGAEHRRVINQYAAEGWRYVGCIPTGFTGHGVISSMDLVFERPAGEG